MVLCNALYSLFTNSGLSLEQVDTLWNCLAEDPECTDDCFHWFLNQAKSKDQHAMGLDTFKHIFMEKVYESSLWKKFNVGMKINHFCC